jgi:hypothetical protein
MNADEKMDAIETYIDRTSPFDITPRGIRFRPDEKLSAALDAITSQKDVFVKKIEERMKGSADFFHAMIWFYCLKKIDTSSAREATARALSNFKQAGTWQNGFPGIREMEIFLGARP